MLKVEIVEGNRIHFDRLAANGFRHRPELDYIGHTMQDFGKQVEVWTKRDGKRQSTLIDFSDLPELEER